MTLNLFSWVQVALSPGPRNPADFWLSDKIDLLVTKHDIPGFGVPSLGLQGMVEQFGGELGVLRYPMHRKPSPFTSTDEAKSGKSIFAGILETFEVARYHSLHGISYEMPSCLKGTARTENSIVKQGYQTPEFTTFCCSSIPSRINFDDPFHMAWKY